MMTCDNMVFNLFMSIGPYRRKSLPSFQIASFFRLRNTNRSTRVLPPAPLSRLAPDKMWPSNLLTKSLKNVWWKTNKITQQNDGGLGWCGRCGPIVQHPILIQKKAAARPNGAPFFSSSGAENGDEGMGKSSTSQTLNHLNLQGTLGFQVVVVVVVVVASCLPSSTTKNKRMYNTRDFTRGHCIARPC